MPSYHRLLAALCLAGAPLTAAAPAAQAQAAVPAASLTPGTKVYDQNGEEIGRIVKVTGDKVAVAIDGNIELGKMYFSTHASVAWTERLPPMVWSKKSPSSGRSRCATSMYVRKFL